MKEKKEKKKASEWVQRWTDLGLLMDLAVDLDKKNLDAVIWLAMEAREQAKKKERRSENG